jgi:hypothetical protein
MPSVCHPTVDEGTSFPVRRASAQLPILAQIWPSSREGEGQQPLWLAAAGRDWRGRRGTELAPTAGDLRSCASCGRVADLTCSGWQCCREEMEGDRVQACWRQCCNQQPTTIRWKKATGKLDLQSFSFILFPSRYLVAVICMHLIPYKENVSPIWVPQIGQKFRNLDDAWIF